MISVQDIFDSYGRKARLFPAFLTILPALVLIGFYTSIFQLKYEHLIWGIVAGAALYFLADLARRRGKVVEKALLKEWGGYPSKMLLRHSNKSIDMYTKQRYHRRAETLISGLNIPSEPEETLNPDDADQRYESIVRYLLANTRDLSKFALLLKENINYGFRRNLLGLKPAAISIRIILLLFILWLSKDNIVRLSLPNQPELGLLVAGFAEFMIWLFLVTKQNVRESADDYAKQLLASLDNL